MTLDLLQRQQPQFCALVYNPRQNPDSLSLEKIIVILVGSKPKEVNILVRPNWQTIVEEDDRDYVQELLKDFKLRLRLDPEGLLKQASLLSAGPLLTYASGHPPFADNRLLSLLKEFEKA